MQRTEATLEPSPIGRVLGERYRLLRVLGAGGMGQVFEAENLRTGRHVAVKVLDAAKSDDSGQVARFLQEARAAARIAHPNVVDVIDLDRDGDELFIVQELLVGEDLQHLLDERGRLSPQETLSLAVPALKGLAYAHARGVVHRDIKPSNLFLAREGDGATVPKIIDFGISKLTGDDAPAMVLTTTGEVFGTPAYMAPEQLRGARGVDARADVWAFGVVLFECLSGELPVESDNYNVLVHEVLSGRRRALLDVAPDVPEALAAVVSRAMAMDPADRYANGEALLDALTPFASTERPRARRTPAPAAPPAPRETLDAPTVRRPRWPFAAAALFALVPLGFAARALSPRAPAPRAALVAQPPPAPAAPPTPAAVTTPPPVIPAAIVDAGPPVELPPPAAPRARAERSARRHHRAPHESEAPAAQAPTTPAARPNALTPGGAYPGP